MDKEDRVVFWVIAAGIVVVAVVWVAGSHFEARAYERITGKHVSTLDAMFVELRVQEPALETSK